MATGETIQYDLKKKSIGKLLLQYSGPAIIESVCVSLYNIVDSMFIGHAQGALAIAGLAVALPLMNLVVAFCTLVSTGGAAISSIFLGKKDFDKATTTVNNVMLLCLIHAIVFGGVALVFLDPILYFFGATDVTIGFARRFMRVIIIATPVTYIFLGLNNIMRATGYPKKAMISALLSVIVNVAIAPLFIFHFKWGIEGAALATVAGQFTAFLWCLNHFCNHKSLVRLDTSKPWFVPKIAKKMYAIGLAPFLMNVCACIVVVFLNKALLQQGGTEGNLDISAYGIINRVTMVFVMIVFGITMGMQPIIGYNYGAGLWNRVMSTLKHGIWLGVIVTGIGWILTECFPDMLTEMFTNNSEVMRICRTGFRIYFICYPLVGAQIVIQNFFQYIDKPKYSIALSMTRQLIFLLPLILILPPIMGVPGVWTSMAVSDALSFLVAILILWYMLRELRKHPIVPTTKTSQSES